MPRKRFVFGIFLAASPGPDYSAAAESDSLCPAGFFSARFFYGYLSKENRAVRLLNVCGFAAHIQNAVFL